MSSKGSVTRWLDQAQAGETEAAQQLWQRYFDLLVRLARGKLQGAPRRMADEEDVAHSAFDSFYRGVEQGRFPRLGDRNNLWRLLVVITARKAGKLKRDAGRQKRGGRREQEPSTPQPAATPPRGEGIGQAQDLELEELIGREPSPDFAAQVAEECGRLLELLGDDNLRTVAVMKMEGYTVPEIASRLGCVTRTVERRLEAIRAIWAPETTP